MKLSPQDKKDLDKYTKFLALKAAQVIIQSRLGEKVSTTCKSHTTCTDWFSLHINDFSEILSEAKKVYNSEMVFSYVPLCVEISLRTSDGAQLVLECWCLSMLPEQCDPTMLLIQTIYNRMGILLKSLVSVTRVTPAYKLSRRQGPDSYVICYRIYMDQPQLHNLGDGYKQVRIGQICTPIGTVQLSVAYRTKMTISPTQTEKNNSIMVKSDHFNTNTNTRKLRNSEDINDLTKPMRPGPFADPKPRPVVPPQLPGVTRLLAMGKCRRQSTAKNSGSESDESTTKIGEEKQEDFKLEEKRTESKDNSPTSSSINSSTITSTTNNVKSSENESMMKQARAPFATASPNGELMHFYRECKRRPPLQSPQKTPSADEISKMLEMFELKLPEYDALVQSFCQSPDN